MPRIEQTRRDPSQSARRIAAAGIFFQGGAACVASDTIVASLVHGLTGSPAAVGLAAAISRIGWLAPQLPVAYAAGLSRRRMPLYKMGAFGRTACLAALVPVLIVAGPAPGEITVILFFLLWTVYAFVSGIVAVPYNDIVARSVPSERRSRLLAVRFFGGGLVALLVAALAHAWLSALSFPLGHAAVIGLGAALLLASALFFVAAGEPEAPASAQISGFGAFLRRGRDVLREDERLRNFILIRWLDGGAAMVLPFYVVVARDAGISGPDVAILLGLQTAGALVSNPMWGWWGDHVGKASLLRGISWLGAAAPLLALAWTTTSVAAFASPVVWFGFVFLVLGAIGNGSTIAQLGYLWEISPDGERPAYSGYFNAIVAPAAAAPLLAAPLITAGGAHVLFAVGTAFAVLTACAARRLVDRAHQKE